MKILIVIVFNIIRRLQQILSLKIKHTNEFSIKKILHLFKMDILDPNLRWLFTKLLSDGQLSILTNESQMYNRFIYFNKTYDQCIQEVMGLPRNGIASASGCLILDGKPVFPSAGARFFRATY